MKIIIAGAGEVGSHLAKMLSNEYHDLTIIDNDEARLNRVAESADVVTIFGSPTSISTLSKAGAASADLFIAVSPAQEQDVNIISSLLAKKMGSTRVTARINNDEYLENDNKILFTEMGIDLLFYPEKIASHEIIDLLKQTGTSEFMDFSGGKLQLIAFRLDDGAPLIDKTIGELSSSNEEPLYRAVAVAREGQTIIPRRDTKFKEHDLVFVISKRAGVHEVMAYSGKNNINVRRLMIVGGGRIGEMVAKKLENSVDYIKLIELRKERCELLNEKLSKTLVINGDARNTDLLIEEDVNEFDAFVAVTSSSETNILSCVMAKKMGVAKTIAEVENIEYIKLAENMGVDAVINKKLITASRIFRFTLSNKVQSIKCLNGSDAEILEFIVNPNSLITKDKIRNLGFPKDAIIGGVIRGNHSYIALGDTEIKAYDRVVVFALPSALKKVNKFFI
ncbi:MAG TPA: Trk system potassium transporter TrkA [Bacteroidales bacterium]|nr:Trk system potassium transporter TrkA [Bacteroidales bacterium]HRR49038.1 Trk system potassium transporter TrkA [Bacteroidales bacterium]HRT33398.1 Trk system potassium transporter TrkA [Bacteroidales bacterium]HRT83172.1 Trk system potassium transporter TrkA [Bacteroidales bacterium]